MTIRQSAGVAIALIGFGSCKTVESLLPSTDVSEIENALTSAAFEIADKDKDGAVTYAEAQVADPESTREEFDWNDLDSSGSLSIRELEVGINRRGAFNRVVAKADANGNGTISPMETARFRKAMRQASRLDNFAQLKAALD